MLSKEDNQYQSKYYSNPFSDNHQPSISNIDPNSKVYSSSAKQISENIIEVVENKNKLIPFPKKHFTDLCCLIIFVSLILNLIICSLYFFIVGNPIDKFLIKNFDDNICGKDNLKEFPYLYFFNDNLNNNICINECANKNSNEIKCNKQIDSRCNNIKLSETINLLNTNICISVSDLNISDKILKNLSIDGIDLVLFDLQDSLLIISLNILLSLLISIILNFCIKLSKKKIIYFIVILFILINLCLSIGFFYSFYNKFYIMDTDNDDIDVSIRFWASNSLYLMDFIIGLIYLIFTLFFCNYILFNWNTIQKIIMALKPAAYFNKNLRLMWIYGFFSFFIFIVFFYIIIILQCYLATQYLGFFIDKYNESNNTNLYSEELIAIFGFIMLIWIYFICISLNNCINAIVCGKWFFKNEVKNDLSTLIMGEIKNLIKYHMGSIFLGSFLTMITAIIKLIIRIIFPFPNCIKYNKNKLLKSICFINRILKDFDLYITKYTNNNAFLMIVIFGNNYIESTKLITQIIDRNTVKYKVDGLLGQKLSIIIGFVISSFSSMITLLLIILYFNKIITFFPFIIISINGFIISIIFLNNYTYTMDILYILFCLDEEQIVSDINDDNVDDSLRNSLKEIIKGIYSKIMYSLNMDEKI